MQLTTALVSLLFGATATSAFHLPNTYSEGVFRAYIDENGKEVHERLSGDALAPIPKHPAPTGVSKRETGSNALFKRDHTWCGCGFNMDPGSCDAAVQDLKNQFGSPPGKPVNGGMSYYSIRGPVVAFVCNGDRGGFSFWNSDSLGRAYASITGSCGRYIAGTYNFFDNSNTVAGYMRYNNGLDFCGAARGSTDSHC